jgi:trimethylamine corrinoid protein
MAKSREDILNKLKESIEVDTDLAQAAKEAVDAGIEAMDAIQNGLGQGMNTINDLFDEGEMFVPQILIAAEAFRRQWYVTANRAKPWADQAGKVIVHGTGRYPRQGRTSSRPC